MFDSVLIANRGEIAVRIIRTLRALGIRSVAVYSDADARARHVREADEAVRIGPAVAAESYLSPRRVLDAARRAGAQAVHPGYGFLAENAAFARACTDAGLVFVGPPAAAIEAMGDKIRAKQTIAAAGVPVVPGRAEPGLSDEDLVAAADEVGYPVLLKPAAGGGGKGMRRVPDPDGMRAAITGARREARGAFGDDTLLVEPFVTDPRHIEIQVLADSHGAVVHLGERECSLQRRHQKIVEEAPSPLLADAEGGAAVRQRMGRAAVEAARAVGYTGAGTVEFLVSGRQAEGQALEFFFLEMNTRLQVEHPVTELVCTVGEDRGVDLVELQLRVAAGEPLPFAQDDVHLSGHAVQARIYAETVSLREGFLPSGGRVLALSEPEGTGVRVDSGLVVGTEVGGDYDPMLAKVIAWGADRGTALRRLDGALARTTVLGVPTTTAFLRALLRHQDVVAGRLDTGLVERHLDELVEPAVPDAVLAAAALERLLALEPTGPVVDPWEIPSGWRIGESAETRWRIEAAGQHPVDVRIRGRAVAAEVVVGDGDPVPAAVRACGLDLLEVAYDGVTRHYAYARDGAVCWLGYEGRAVALTESEPLAAARTEHSGGAVGAVRSPMPGTVLAVSVAQGSMVTAGTPLLVIEAMKMEHAITAPVDGVVTELHVGTGQQVAVDEVLVTVAASARPSQE